MMLEAKQSVALNLMYPPLILVVEYLSLDAEKMMILGILLLTDFIAGVSKAHVLGERITYERAMAGVITKIFIFSIPLLLALMAKGIEQDINEYVGYALSALIVAETYSIFENGYAVKNKEAAKEVDLVSYVMRLIRAFLERMLKGGLK